MSNQSNDSTLFVVGAVLIILSSLLGFITGKRHPIESPARGVIEKVDTLLVHDTITLNEPVFVEKRVVESVLVPVRDSVTVHDTLYVIMEREQLVWQDSLSSVYASGILPRIDSVKHYVTTKVVTIDHVREVTKMTRWGVGVSAGYGFSKDGMSPYVGVGIHYNLLSW